MNACDFETLERRRLLSAGGADPYFHDIAVPENSKPLVLADGRLIIATQFKQSDGQGFIRLLRYSANGTQDSTYHAFAGGTPSLRADASPDQLSPLAAVDSRGRVVVSVNEMLYRVDTTGKLDERFGRHGAVGPLFDYSLADLLVQPDDRIVVGGWQTNGNPDDPSGTAAVVERLTADGKLDQTFGDKGISRLSDFGGSDQSFTSSYGVTDLFRGHNGQIIPSKEYRYSDDLGRDIQTNTLVRLDASGSILGEIPDILSTSQLFQKYDDSGVGDVQVLPDGRILAIVNASDHREGALVRVNVDGSLDTTFAGEGVLDEPTFLGGALGNAFSSVTILSNGKMMVGATATTGQVGGQDIWRGALLRYNADGSLDATFGNEGILLYPEYTTIDTTLAPDGSLIASMFERDQSKPDALFFSESVRRLWRDESPVATLHTRSISVVSSTSQTFDVTYRDDGSVDLASLDNRDLRVTGPSGFIRYAKVERVVSSTNANGMITVRYKLAAPGGSWDAADNGVYSIRLMNAQVRDTDANGTGARTLGQFVVEIVASAPARPMGLAARNQSVETAAATTRSVIDDIFADL